MRLLVTGSRDWPDKDPHPIIAYVSYYYDRQPTTIVVGYDPERDYPPGVDRIVYNWMADCGWEEDVEPYPADWNRHGNAAGPIRNQQMVKAGADLCLAFFNARETPGTADCCRRAIRAGIPVYSIWRHPTQTTLGIA